MKRRRFVGAAIACCAGLGIAAAAFGQEATGPAVLIVDMQRLQRDTAAARSIREQSTAIRQQIEKAIASREAVIRAEEKELADLRENLSADDFRERVRAFEEKVFESRDFAQQESAKLQAALSDASRRMRAQIVPILAAMMRERRAQVMLDSSQVVLSAEQLEVTDEVIERLDAVVPDLKLAIDAQVAPEPARE